MAPHDHAQHDHAQDRPLMSRRGLLRSAALGGLVVTVGATTVFDPAYAGTTTTQTISGKFTGTTPDWHYLPVEVPAGVSAIDVSYSYDHTTYGLPNNTLGNSLDIGIFDPSGHDLGDAAGFRGWSGGARTSFHLSNGGATPGYLAGPIDPGTWNVVLGPYSVAPTTGLSWTVIVTLTHGAPEAPYQPAVAPLAVDGTGPGWYRGDMHIHSVHSDGKRSLAQIAAAARAAGLDFIASTDHNTSSAGLDWGRWAPDDLLVINGEEVTTRGGHWLALGLPAGTWVDWRYRAGDHELAGFADQVRALGGLVGAAHPFSPYPGTLWTFGYRDVDLVEVWNGPWTADDQVTVVAWHAGLVAGKRYPAIGDSDAHTTGDVIGLPQNVVHAEDLSTASVLAAVRAGRSWIAESSAVDLTFTAVAGGSTAQIGDTAVGKPFVDVRLDVRGAPRCVAVVYGAAGPLGVAVADSSGRISWHQKVPGRLARFVRAEVRRLDARLVNPLEGMPTAEMVALTNPIWLG